MASNVFPSTMRTWIDDELDRGHGGRQDVNAYLMETYAFPLQVYYLGTNARWLGEPDDVISGFFVSRLARADFYANWQSSGMRLRRWLINAFCYYLKELRRERQRRHQELEDSEGPVTFTGDPNVAVDQAAVVAFVRQAMEHAHLQCRAEGLQEHWDVFLRHHHDGLPFKEIAAVCGIDAARAQVMSRTAARKFRAALRDVLRRDGVADDQIDDEIKSLVEGDGP
jgi:DNA-directed RNA polymerase specialized sigma24 family protein